MIRHRRAFAPLLGLCLLAACDADPGTGITGAAAPSDPGAEGEWIRGIDLRPDLSEVVGYGFTRSAAKVPSPGYAVAAAGAGHTVERSPASTEVEITFEGLGNYDAVPATAHAAFPKWIAHVDMDVAPGYPAHTGNFANEPSPSTAVFWYYEGAASKTPSSRDIVLDRPVSRFSLYYAACLGGCLPPPRRGEVRPPVLPHITLTAYDAAGAVVDSATGGENYGASTGDPTGTFNRWDRLEVELGANDNRIVRVRITGYEEYVGVDDVGFLIVNFAPVAVPGGPYAGVEGTPVQFGGSVSYDPVDAAGLPHPQGDPVTYLWDFGDGGTSTQPNPGHAYANSGTYTATLTVTDPNLVPHTATTTVTVANVAPAVNAGAPTATVGGGEAFRRAGSFTDPGGDAWTATVDYGDGSGARPLDLTPGKTFDLEHAYTTRGTYTVVVTVDDGDGGVGTDEVVVTVGNRAPSVDAGADATVPEGSVFTGAGSFADPDTHDVWAALVDYGDGGGEEILLLDGTSFALGHAYDDNAPGGGPYTVTVSVSDGEDAGEDAVRVTVTNVAPTATFVASAGVAGEPVEVALTGAADPSAADEAAGFQYAFDCGAGFGPYSTAPAASCPTAAAGPLTVRGRVRDKDGGATEYSASVVVGAANQPPTAAIEPVEGASEGVAVRFGSDGSADPEGGPLAHAWDFGAPGGGDVSTLPSPSFTYPDDGTYTVTLTVTDEGGLSQTVTRPVSVANVAPTAAFAVTPTSIVAGGTVRLTLSSPVDVAADLPGLTYSFDCGAGYAAPSAASDAYCTAPAPGTYTVRGRVHDADGGASEYSATVAVSAPNQAPVAAILAGASVPEGGAMPFSAAGSADPEGGALTYAWDFGDGATGTEREASHAYADDGAYTVTLVVTDPQGASGAATHAVEVVNVAPTADFHAAPSTVTEGGTFALSLSDPVDPSPADAAAGFRYAFDCGAGGGWSEDSGDASVACPAAGVGPRTVRGKVRDADGGESAYAATVTVLAANAAPTVSLGGASGGAEGATLSFVATATDPDGDALAYAWDFGDGGGAIGPSATHAYADEGTGSYTVTVTVTDGKGGTAVASRAVSIANVAPTAAFAAAPTSVTAGKPFALSLTGAADPSPVDVAAGFTYAFDCGAGAGYGPFGATATATCPTTAAGTRAVKGKVRDADGGVREYTAAVTVTPQAVVVIPINIDVKPETINLPKNGSAPSGELTVHVYAYAGFDLDDLAVGSITLGDGVGSDTPALTTRTGEFKITGGGKHVVIHFSRAALFANGDLKPSTTRLTLKASLLHGSILVQGWDKVRITR